MDAKEILEKAIKECPAFSDHTGAEADLALAKFAYDLGIKEGMTQERSDMVAKVQECAKKGDMNELIQLFMSLAGE